MASRNTVPSNRMSVRGFELAFDPTPESFCSKVQTSERGMNLE